MNISLTELLSVFSKNTSEDFISSLSDGDVFKAEIIDISDKTAEVKLPDGKVIKAQLAENTDIYVGGKAEFTAVKSNGKMIFKLNETTESTAKKTLEKIGVAPSKQNTEVMKLIIENSLMPDSKNINKALFFKFSGLSDSEVAFMLKENMPADKESTDMLIKLKNEGITELVKRFAENVIKDKDKAKIKAFIKKYSFDPKKDSPKQIKEKLKNLEIIAEKEMKSEDSETAETAQTVRNMLKFISEITEYKTYLQLPIMNESFIGNSEIFVFGNPEKIKASKKVKALLCLDFESIGHTDIFIEKNENKLSFSFRLENEHIISVFKSNIKKLSELLPQYSISAEFKKCGEKFDITYDGTEKAEIKKYSFDMKA